MRILLIEDNETCAELTQHLLSRWPGPPVKIDIEMSVAAALERLATNEYDLVVLDLTLLDSAGLPTLHKIMRGRRSTPILVYSAVEQAMEPEIVGNGAAFLSKGTDASKIWGVVEQLIHDERTD